MASRAGLSITAVLVAVVVVVVVLGPACGSMRPQEPALPGASQQEQSLTELGDIVESYVKLSLAMGLHDPAFVDAYYGPPEWRAEIEKEKPSLAAIRDRGVTLQGRLAAVPAPAGDDLPALRHRYLEKHLRALMARLDIVGGKKLRFDDESKLLYDAVAPVIPEARFDEVLARLDRLVPGPGPLLSRIDTLRNALIIPRDRLEAVFNAAIRECRTRTVAHITLPENESFTVEYVTDKPWGAYNWYKGDYRSVIQVNTDLPIFIDRALDLACHEGYPGHHVMGILVEKRLVRERGMQELTVLPLFSPTGLIAEGSANYGIELAFPGEERAAFEQTVLVALAGLDPGRARVWGQVSALMKDLKHATNQAGRRYIDGEIDAAGAAAYLSRYGLMQPDRATKMVSFIDANRSYIINYNLGEDLVGKWIAKGAGKGADAEVDKKRWAMFEKLISSPMTAGEL